MSFYENLKDELGGLDKYRVVEISHLNSINFYLESGNITVIEMVFEYMNYNTNTISIHITMYNKKLSEQIPEYHKDYFKILTLIKSYLINIPNYKTKFKRFYPFLEKEIKKNIIKEFL